MQKPTSAPLVGEECIKTLNSEISFANVQK